MLSRSITKTYFTVTYKCNRILQITKVDHFAHKMEHTKDFIRPQYSDPIIDMSEYFIENPQYRVIKYIPIKDGIRCWYVVVS